MRRFDFVLFDLDGTLLDTKEGILAAAVRTMEEYRLPIPDDDALEAMIGPPVQESYAKLFALAPEAAMEMANRFRDRYKTAEYLFRAEPYDGIFDLLQALKDTGTGIGIATYKREDYARRLLCAKGFDRYTEHMYGSDFEGKLKKADIIRLCLEKMGCADPLRAVYIGDGKSDGTGAAAVGMPFLAVTYGFGFKTSADAEPYHPIGVAQTCMQVKDLILGSAD